MDWQKMVSLGIVLLTAGIFLWKRLRPRKFSFERDTHCGCSSPSATGNKSSIVFRARRGQRTEIIIKNG